MEGGCFENNKNILKLIYFQSILTFLRANYG